MKKIIIIGVLALGLAASAYVAYACCGWSSPPEITSVTVNPGSLWPPNHKLVNVAVDVQGSNLAGWQITGASSSEADNGLGDGDTAGDVGAVSADGHSIKLRAERSGTGNGRTYTINIMAWSPSGGLAYPVTVAVTPHDQGK